jgi:hypothetical protein
MLVVIELINAGSEVIVEEDSRLLVVVGSAILDMEVATLVSTISELLGGVGSVVLVDEVLANGSSAVVVWEMLVCVDPNSVILVGKGLEDVTSAALIDRDCVVLAAERIVSASSEEPVWEVVADGDSVALVAVVSEILIDLGSVVLRCVEILDDRNSDVLSIEMLNGSNPWMVVDKNPRISVDDEVLSDVEANILSSSVLVDVTSRLLVDDTVSSGNSEVLEVKDSILVIVGTIVATVFDNKDSNLFDDKASKVLDDEKSEVINGIDSKVVDWELVVEEVPNSATSEPVCEVEALVETSSVIIDAVDSKVLVEGDALSNGE